MNGTLWSARFLDRLDGLGVLRPAWLEPPLPVVSQLTVSAGSVGARVADEEDRGGHDVWVELAAFDARQWARAEQALAAHRGTREALLDGELPLRVEGVLARAGLSLLPARAEDLTLECSCPKWSACGHLTAVLAALAAAFDTDPFLLTAWRGRSRERLLRHVEDLHAAAGRAGDAESLPQEDPRPLDQRLADFWSCGEQHRALAAREAAGGAFAGAADPAPAQLSASGVVVRGRGLEELLRPAYEALSD
ncbi:hypothetical protein ACEZCY_32840 [Streptacidiphilus sp. N1-12]|uniref:SWIM-type domain-containing protein n=2 Tax=Streptacidiphilus alkalitolerans TaxID=3342712 RepID=A0ABV6VJZ1_9ACTN